MNCRPKPPAYAFHSRSRFARRMVNSYTFYPAMKDRSRHRRQSDNSVSEVPTLEEAFPFADCVFCHF